MGKMGRGQCSKPGKYCRGKALWKTHGNILEESKTEFGILTLPSSTALPPGLFQALLQLHSSP